MPEDSASATDARPTTVGIVPHTHWDREWYAPFQVFRARLVRLLDALLPLLERDLSYARFLLDGQTVVVDDYLEVRPEAADTLQRLAATGRVSVGPWMVLMDEFMVSGETIVRDLQLGLRRATDLGGAMQVGYLPDMFGHIAQMPQILRLAGFEHAVVWRGVPSTVTQTAFRWEAPDGSAVRAEYLYGSYSNGRDLPDDAKQLVARARSYGLELGPARLPGGAMLLMNGTDHQMPQPWLGRVVAEANAIQDDYRFVVTSLPEYLADQPTEGLRTVRGELRSGARANVLMGVASNRVDVHQACAVAERSLERRAEPLSALLVPADRHPDSLLGIAWRKVVENSAHDSSCACSDDEVVDQVLVRYREARQIGDVLAREAVRQLATEVDVPAGSTLVVNPTQTARGGLVSVNVPGEGPFHLVSPDGAAHPTQELGSLTGDGFSTIVSGQKVRWVIEMMNGPEFAGERIGHYDMTEADDGALELVFRGAQPGEPPVDLTELRDELVRLGDEGRTMRFRVIAAPVRRAIFAADDVPGFGWRSYTVAAGAGPATAVTSGPSTLDNEHLHVEVAADGTYAITTSDGVTVSGLGRFVDGGDGGDTYNYSPPEEDVLVDRPDRVDVAPLESGPVRARMRIDATYSWPTHAIGDEGSCSRRADDAVPVTVHTTLELRAGERFLRVHTELDNPCRDHRLRAHFPLPAHVSASHAECAFAVVERGLTAEGGPNEFGLPTFVSRRFVDASDGNVGLAIVHDGLLEYELPADDGAPSRELALTLLRATGFLSRLQLSMRASPAGYPYPLAGPQILGHRSFDYALVPHRGDWRDANLYDVADEVLVPLERIRAGGVAGAARRPTGARLRVDGARVSAVLREPGGLVVRVFNPSPEPTTATVEQDGAPATGWTVDLVGRPSEHFEGGVELGPWEIATLRLDGAPS
ncbi:MAG TPA: glycoside hydrolase family 38 C-terminal domain-containing protein [Acidimicrobiia bacterium]|nr:glycoside hydrolase family 38 C-terminal domain-containing protein [Acidimicrobiia bacterium]